MKKLLGVMFALVIAVLILAVAVVPAGALIKPPPQEAGGKVLYSGEPDVAIPTLINYQGYLTDSGGNPIDDTVSIAFTVYDAATDGSVVWTETQPAVTVNDGLFNVLLGSLNPINASDLTGTRYLGITVGADPEMTPRQQIVSVAYALRADEANNANTLDGVDSNAFVAVGGDTMTGVLNLPDNGLVVGTDQMVLTGGNVGIGTADPVGVLDVLTYASEELDQQQASASHTIGSSGSLWQSFTAGKTGLLADIELWLYDSYSGALYVREGEGTGGPIISSHSVNLGSGWVRAGIGDCNVVSGQQYTIQLNGPSSWNSQTGDPYPGGTSSYSSDHDFAFKTYVLRKHEHFVVKNIGGNVGIGTTDPGTKLAVVGLPSTSSYSLVRIDTSSGDFYVDSSSERYKEDIQDLEGDFDVILDAEPKSYMDKASGQREIGYIAEDLDELGLTDLVIYNGEGEPDGLKYDRISLYLVEIIKAQQSQIEDLLERVEALEQANQ